MARLITREDFDEEALNLAEADRISKLSIEEVHQELLELEINHELPKSTEDEIYRNLLAEYRAQIRILSHND